MSLHFHPHAALIAILVAMIFVQNTAKRFAPQNVTTFVLQSVRVFLLLVQQGSDH